MGIGDHMSVKVKVDISKIEKKFSRSTFTQTRKQLGDQILADCTPFVPKDEGFLRSSGDVAPDGSKVIWDEPYAKAQFYGRVGKTGAP
ncbi:UNVERIFIED_CONTAM: minor capsid protein, partial [Kocuria sp. CPCC 205274]